MGFWERNLGTPQQPQQPAGSAPAAQRAWWQGDAPVAAQAVPQAAPQGDELAGHDFSKATHLKQRTECPDCGGGNLAVTGKQTSIAVPGGIAQASRCFDCGWPVANSTKGLGATAGEAADGASRQVATGGAIVNNYQPQNVIAGAIRSASDLRF